MVTVYESVLFHIESKGVGVTRLDFAAAAKLGRIEMRGPIRPCNRPVYLSVAAVSSRVVDSPKLSEAVAFT